jgi:HEAT repeat protein
LSWGEPLGIETFASEKWANAAVVLDGLIDSLKDKDAEVRDRAAWWLGERRRKARKAVPALIELLKDESPDVRSSAAEAFKKIDPDTARKVGVDEK